MGRIKSLMVKRAAKQLMIKENENYTQEFNQNKRALGSNMPSKSVRNKIAGYLSRLIRMKNSPIRVRQKPVEEKSSSFKPTHSDKYY